MLDTTLTRGLPDPTQVPWMARQVVLGMGNILMRDDGVGIRVIENLKDTAQRWPRAVFVDGGTLSFALLPYLEEATQLIVVDAMELHCPAGTVEVFRGASMDSRLGFRSGRTVHELAIKDLLDMARLQDALPAERALIGIQPGRIELGCDLTLEVEIGKGAAARQVRRLLEERHD